MYKVYCFIEEEGSELNDFIKKYDSTCEIHIFSPIAESCEKKLFYCLGEITNILTDSEEKSWFVTDVIEIHEYIIKMYHSYFDKIFLVDKRNDRCFDSDIDYMDLLEFEMAQVLNIGEQAVLKTLLELNVHIDVAGMYDAADGLFKAINRDSWKKTAFWIHALEMILFYMSGKKQTNSFQILLYSALMKLNMNVEYTNRLLSLCLESENIEKEHLYFVWNQFKNIRFKKLAASNNQTLELLDKIYEKSYHQYWEQEKDRLLSLNLAQRNPNRVLVMTIQFLDDNHAPTRTVIERCKALKSIGKEVYIINTTEQYTAKGVIPFYGATGGSVEVSYDEYTQIELGGDLYRFKQLPKNQTIEDRLQQMIAIIHEYKPYYILSIGSGSMIADLCGNMIDCIPMALVFSTLPHTMNPIRILGRNMTEEESKKQKGVVIESRFTFELKESGRIFTRSGLGLPEDRFLLVVIGIRLDYEMDDEFLETLSAVLKKGCHVVFAGIFNQYEAICEKFPVVAEHSTFIGYCEDVSALMEICDLYINPRRLGGGFSIIEAFDKGVPGVYLPYGDVFIAGGSEFQVSDYQKMEETIAHYQNDKLYYKEMSEKAKRRAAYMTDSIEAMKELDMRIRKEIENRKCN